jgi:phage baseplate assembly protein W
MSKGFVYRNTILDRVGGSIGTSQTEENIKDSLRVLLSTRKGDRVGIPSYGCGVIDRIFDPLDDFSENIIRDDIYRAVKDWEPRINVTAVSLEVDYATFTYSVKVDYDIVDTTNTVRVDEIE